VKYPPFTVNIARKIEHFGLLGATALENEREILRVCGRERMRVRERSNIISYGATAVRSFILVSSSRYASVRERGAFSRAGNVG
jgi:hypothetical protein